MKKTSNMKASNMKRVLLTLALLAGLSTMSYAQTYREITNTKLIINSSYPSGNALTLRTGAGQAAYTLTLPASAPANGDILRVDPSTANTLIWTSPLDMYVFENGLTESGTNTVKWGGALTGATIINTAGSNAITFYNNTAASTAAMTIGGGAGTLTLDVRGATTINTSGTANTSIGNATGTFELNSAALDVTTAGAISGVTTLNMNGALTNAATSNQIILGTGTTVTLTAPTPAANAVYTIPDVGTTGSFVLTTGAQTISGAKTFSSAVTITNSDASTSTSTGALIVTGGIGSGGRLNVAGNTSLEGDVAIGNASADALTINAAAVTASNLPTTGASTHSLVVSNAGTLVTGSVATIIGDHAWMVGGNTITGASTSRKIGINTQAANDDDLEIITDGQTRMTFAAAGTNTTLKTPLTVDDAGTANLVITEAGLTRANSISLTSSTDNNIVLTSGVASATFGGTAVNLAVVPATGSTDQTFVMNNTNVTLGVTAKSGGTKVASIDIANGSPSIAIYATNDGVTDNTFTVLPTSTTSTGALILGKTTAAGSARIHDGSGGTEGILVTSGLSADRTYTMNVDADAAFVMTAGAQTIGGAKTFSSALSITDATGSTSTSTGSLTVGGGAGFGENVYIGGTLNAAGNTALSGTLAVTGATTLNGNVTLGDAAADVVTVTGTIAGASPLVFEGSTSNANQTTFAITDPTVDRTITFPDATGTVLLADGSGNMTVTGNLTVEGNTTLGNAATDVITFTGTIAGASPLVFEGATSDGSQTTFAITDPTADRTITFPDASGTVITTGNSDDLVWEVGGNTITGGSTTRRIGIATQATNPDGLALYVNGSDRLTINSSGNTTFSGTATVNSAGQDDLVISESGITRANSIGITSSTGDGVTLTAGIASATFSGATSAINIAIQPTSGTEATDKSIVMQSSGITIGNSPRVGYNRHSTMDMTNGTNPTVVFQVSNEAQTASNALTIATTSTTSTAPLILGATTTAGSARIHDGSGGTEGIIVTSGLSADRTYTLNVDADASFVMTEGTQTVNGAKTFGSALAISDNTGSTSTTTGALKVTGGAGIGENLFVAGTLNATGNTSLGGTLAVTGNSTFNGNTTLGDASGDAVTINAATVTAANLQSDGTSSHRLVVSDAGTLRTASLSTMVSGTVWLLDGNTTGGTKTIGSNDANDIGLETNGTTRLTITSAGASTFSGSLTSTGAFTANGAATLGDGNDDVVINAGTGKYSIASSALNVSTAGAISGVTTQSMSDALTITKTTNQIALSSAGAGVATLTTATLAGNRTYTIPEAGADASFVMTAGAQTVGGAKTFSASTVVEGDLTLGAGTSSDGGSIILNDDATGSSNTATVKAANQGASRTYSIPDAGADASFVMTEGTQTINGQTTLAATTTFQSALKFPFTRNTTAGAYTVTANDFVVIQTVNGAINLPAGADGRMLILKNTAAGATINITPNGTQTCDAATLAEGASITLIFNGGNWYQVGN